MKTGELNFEKLELLSDASLKTIRGGNGGTFDSIQDPVTANTVTVPGGKDDGDDGIKND